MTSNLSKIGRYAALILIAAMLHAIAADAPVDQVPGQPGRPRGNRGNNGPGNVPGGGPGNAGFNGPGPGGFQGGGPAGGIALDDKQRELFKDALQKESDELRQLDEKLRAAQKELIQAVIAEKADEITIREKAEAVAKIEVEMTLLRAKAFATVAPTLKPEQREQFENSRFGAAILTGGGQFNRDPQAAGGRGRGNANQPRPRDP